MRQKFTAMSKGEGMQAVKQQTPQSPFVYLSNVPRQSFISFAASNGICEVACEDHQRFIFLLTTELSRTNHNSIFA